jgi:hypothetical protein
MPKNSVKASILVAYTPKLSAFPSQNGVLLRLLLDISRFQVDDAASLE